MYTIGFPVFWGVNLPHLPPLPQTIKNFDKAMGRLVLATGENFSSRLENNTAIQKAKTAGLEAAIKASAKGFFGQIKGGGDQYERSIEYTFGKNILYQKNREDVARLTFQQMGSSAQAETVDAAESISDDWLNAFSDIVEKKSNEDIQSLWAKILAGEIRKPGTFRLKSLLSMSAIDSIDAAQINTILSKVINGDFIFRVSEEEDLNLYMNAEYLDVLSVGGGIVSKKFTINEGDKAYFIIGQIVLMSTAGISTKLILPAYLLNQFGKNIYSLSSYSGLDENYVLSIIAKLKSFGFSTKRAYIVNRTGNVVRPSPFIDC